MEIIENKIFDKIDFTVQPMAKTEFEYCVFKNCDFADSDLSEMVFLECQFLDCNLSLTKISKTAFRDVKFNACKMLGLLFYNCNEFGLTATFDNCNLTHSSFYKRKIKKTLFINCRLHEVDFTDCDLSESIFDQCDLANAKFENTNLEKADFRTAYNYSINPELNKLKKAKFTLSAIAGLLDKYDIRIE
jgi:uncharacterized protein YjbI with pentapeptide repeats